MFKKKKKKKIGRDPAVSLANKLDKTDLKKLHCTSHFDMSAEKITALFSEWLTGQVSHKAKLNLITCYNPSVKWKPCTSPEVPIYFCTVNISRFAVRVRLITFWHKLQLLCSKNAFLLEHKHPEMHLLSRQPICTCLNGTSSYRCWYVTCTNQHYVIHLIVLTDTSVSRKYSLS